jgi:hypothetical protein
MKTILFIIITAFISVCVRAQDDVQVSCVIKPRFAPEARTKLVEKSVALLSSCAYADLKPKWGAPGEPQSITDIEKQSHLDFVFATPRTVEVPIIRITVKVNEMVIQMPLITGGIWVRTDDGIIYLSKYKYPILQEIDDLLLEAQKHDTGA